MGRKTARNTKDGMRFVRSRKRKGKKSYTFLFLSKKVILLFLLIIICLLQGIKIQIVNDLAIKDYEYAYLLLQIKKQIQENSILHEEILRDEAYTTILVEANNKGFKSATFIYLK